LHVYRASNPHIRVQTGGGDYSYIRLDDGSSNGYLIKNVSAGTGNGALAGALYTYTDNNKAFQHIHAGAPLFTILSGGNVGIGTTSPDYRLTVAGDTDTRIRIDGSSTQGIYFTKSGANNGILRVDGSGNYEWYTKTVSQAMVLTDGGLLGIGTVNPGQRLHVDGGSVLINTGTGGSTFNDLQIGGISGWSNAEAHRINFVYGTASSPTIFTTIESEFLSGDSKARLHFRNMFNGAPSTAYTMTLRGDGNVGIGTNNPSTKLHVIKNDGGNGSSGLSDFGIVCVSESGGDQATIGAYAVGDQYANLNLASVVGGSLLMWHISKRVSSQTLEYYYYNGTSFASKFEFKTNGDFVAAGNVTAYSDIRIKKNILTIDNALEKVKKLRGVSYNRIDTDEPGIGVIAQEVKKVFPEVVQGSEETRYSVAYGNMVGLLIEAIKELTGRVESLQDELNTLKSKG
jgi:hypothetical protein